MSPSLSVAAAAAFASLWLAAPAIAACSGNSLNQQQISTTLTGNTVCALRGADRWQELHVSGGNLIDYKRGPGHPVDPSESVGSWSVQGNGNSATVVYNYASGGTFAFQVFPNAGAGGSYSFCTGGVDLPVTIVPGGSGCGA